MRFSTLLTICLISFLFAGDPPLAFEKDLSFGPPNEDPHYLWPDTRVTVDVDDQGRIYIADIGESRVLRFDAKGVYLDEVVSKGQGPGEAERLTSFQLLEDGGAVFFQYNGQGSTLHYLDKDMKFVRLANTKDWGFNPISTKFSPSGKKAMVSYNNMDRATMSIITKVSLLEDATVRQTLSETGMPFPNQSRMGDVSYWPTFFAGIAKLYFDKQGLISFDANNRVYHALSDEYQITRTDTAGNSTQIFKRDYSKIPWSDSDLDGLATSISEQYIQGYPPQFKDFMTPDIVRKGLDISGVPSGRNPLKALLPLPNGGLLVVLDEPAAERTQYADVFDKQGAYLGQTSINNLGFVGPDDNIRMVFKKDYAYSIETDSDGDHHLVRYKMAWSN